MSVYAINKFCHRLTLDPAHCAGAQADLPVALAPYDLTRAEKQAIADGDVDFLHRQGAHPLLLVRLYQRSIGGLTEALYSERIRRSATTEGGRPWGS
ncbi:hypothetical protein M2163_000252 [Streptomyces sp. SAI-135]|jgi:hypothetical protein|uniref:hypothetical protein n=1 Tax=unclassified Streptomyces TaxID=2593676 RepID=UPI00247724ED|nr:MULTISPECIES: hypothetical protein [unclassified Streptomyces]MDH6523244.1 hypothetical protein [Streptomyces sp. SAI-090]MDH6554857.1 hypothetical protein [Streptomyces sp. SAI-041]MDH6574127.1 hypothetical protein [Streptomyces sp. SAI-117]MDH6581137.1 hypothetical protein [Streptomyces sp. SAI-133]MDH6613144.1 hypothetical protein [Streptomyces sp. SAI-135]